MPSTFWTDEQTKDLIEAWKNRQADITTFDFAKEHSDVFKRSPNAIAQKIKSLPEFKVPASSRTPWENAPRIDGNAFLIGDTQIPFHHAEFINKCLEVCRR